MIRVSVIEIPPAPSGEAVSLAAGHPVDEFVPGLDEGETVLALAPLDAGESCGVALGTASGIVKRVLPEYPANRDEFELITLKDGDRVIGAVHLARRRRRAGVHRLRRPAARFPASAVRPQGRQAGGMAGIRLSDGATAIWFGALGPAARARPPRPWW